MTLRTRTHAWKQRLASFGRRTGDESGLAAVEFAMLLPFMITLFFGVVESSLALLCRADVSKMAGTAADLISQASSVSSSDISNVYAAAGTILYPYYDSSAPNASTARPTIRLTSIVDDGSGAPTGNHMTGKVAWTCTQSGSGTLSPSSLSVNGTVTLPQPLMTNGGSLIVAEIAYQYASPTTKVMAASINFTNNFYTKPRRVAQIPAPAGGCP